MNDAALAVRLAEKLRDAFARPTLEYQAATLMRDILGFDSVRFVMMILDLEADFGVTLHEDEVDSIYTMGDIFDLLRAKLPPGD